MTIKVSDVCNLNNDQLCKIWAKVIQTLNKRHGQGNWPVTLLTIKEYRKLLHNSYAAQAQTGNGSDKEILTIICTGECKKCGWSFRETGNRTLLCIWEHLPKITVRRRKK